MAPPVCPSEPRENDAFKTLARALHVHHAPQPTSSAPFILYDFGLEAGIAKHCLGPKS